MPEFITRTETLRALEKAYKESVKKANYFFDLFEAGVNTGRKLYLEAPEYKVKGDYLVETCDAFNCVIRLRPCERDGEPVVDLVQVIRDCELNVKMVLNDVEVNF